MTQPPPDRAPEEQVSESVLASIESMGYTVHVTGKLLREMVRDCREAARLRAELEQAVAAKERALAERDEARGYTDSCHVRIGQLEGHVLALERAAAQPARQPAASVEVREACGCCGGARVMIRGRYPHEDMRSVCPTCLAERLDSIRTITAPEYGLAARAAAGATP